MVVSKLHTIGTSTLPRGFLHMALISHDPCLFLCNDCIIALYTNDYCIFANNDAMINVLIASLCTNFVLEDQGPIANYLGIHIDQDIDPMTNFINSIMFTQVGLIDSILTNPGLSPNGQYPSTE